MGKIFYSDLLSILHSVLSKSFSFELLFPVHLTFMQFYLYLSRSAMIPRRLGDFICVDREQFV